MVIEYSGNLDGQEAVMWLCYPDSIAKGGTLNSKEFQQFKKYAQEYKRIMLREYKIEVQLQ